MSILLPTTEITIWNRRVGSWFLLMHALLVFGFYEIFAANYFHLPGKLMVIEAYLLFALTVYMAVRYATGSVDSRTKIRIQDAIFLLQGEYRTFEVIVARRMRALGIRIRGVPRRISKRAHGALSRRYIGASLLGLLPDRFRR